MVTEVKGTTKLSIKGNNTIISKLVVCSGRVTTNYMFEYNRL